MQLASEQVSARATATGDGLSKKEAKQREQGLMQAEAQAVAGRLAEALLASGGFSRVEAVRGYVNIYVDAGAVAATLVRRVLHEGERYGQGPERADRVMIEYSQPNTHKSFHVGHLRNAALGSALLAILRFAGFPVLAANYIGDIGLHVIKTLWCYRAFHQHDVPATDKGRWLGQLYAEAEARLRYRDDVVQFLQTLTEAEYFRPSADRLVKEVLRRGAPSIDIAYLLGRIDFLQKLDVRKFREPATVRVFFELLGPWLRDQIDQERVPAEHLATWEALHAHIAWWDHGADWEQAIKDTFQEWERKDPELLTLWQVTRQWSLDEFMALYAELDVPFDLWFYESEVEEPGRAIVQELLERGIAEISDGLPVVKIDEQLGLETEKYRVLPILRSDGTTLYSTKDLALARVKFEQYQIDRSLYVIDVRQSLYMQQIFKILELWGFPQAAMCFHLGYEFVAMPDGAMSSRKGNVIVLEDVLEEALLRARAIIEEKNPELTTTQKEQISRQVAIGSLKYYMLSRDRNSVIIFDWDKALSFDGQAAPYIQYAHARACRILERSETVIAPDQELVFSELTTEEITLTQELSRFGAEVERAAAGYNPLQIANYVYHLAKIFNDFYHACPVNSAPEPRRTARLALVAATRQVLATGLRLLGIAAPDVM
ncbi:MAG: arginine--tRNA ligase [Chloroflexi bacterium]|nr:arginine--tRNA ligase [Chloroflexota bacterium]